MAKDGYKFVRDRSNVTFLNTAFSHFTYINQLLNVCPRNTGSVEVSGLILRVGLDQVKSPCKTLKRLLGNLLMR